MVNSIHVAVGVIVNARDEVLVAYRPKNKDQGGLWEFPGGKKEKNETIESALEREFFGRNRHSTRVLLSHSKNKA